MLQIHRKFTYIFTWWLLSSWGISLPLARLDLDIVVACVSLAICLRVRVRVCANLKIVQSITHRPIKLDSPKDGQKAQNTYIGKRSYWGAINLDLQGEIQLESQNLIMSGLPTGANRQPQVKT